jgi:CheY-like chemotaxis protein
MAAPGDTPATIVIVEDNPSLLTFLTFAMEQLGNYRVIASPDGIKGLEDIITHRPACVVADVKMPGLDGYQLVQALRGDPDTEDIPIVMMTALAQEKDRFMGLAVGADLYMIKPVAPLELAEAIQRVITTSQAERAYRLQQLAELPQTPTEE